MNWLEVLGWTDDQVKDLRFVAYTYLRQGKYDFAKTFFKTLTTLKKDNAYDLRTLGAIHVQLDEFEEALSCLEQSLEFEPDHRLALLNKTKALLGLNRKDEALKLAKVLSKHENEYVSDRAEALIMAWG